MAPCAPQFDFTSCQGVLFVMLMTLFFSGLLLAILLPFQYVSPQPTGLGGERGRPDAQGALFSYPFRAGPGPKPHSLPPWPALLAPALGVLAAHTSKQGGFSWRPGHLPSS